MSAFSDLVFLAWPFLKFNDHFSATISRAVRPRGACVSYVWAAPDTLMLLDSNHFLIPVESSEARI